MRVFLERSGGFAGMSRNIELDTDALSAEESRTLRGHVDAADFVNLPAESARPARGADRFQYTVRVVTDDDKAHKVTVFDGAIPPALQPLLDYLERKMRQRRR